LTSKITFENVCIAIKNYAFYSSPYPVILSIENHCSHSQQNRMAEIFKQVFGDMLLTPKDRGMTETVGFLGSPEMLQKKIIIKGSMASRVDQRSPKYDADGNLVAPEKEETEEEDSKKEEKVTEALSEVIFLKTASFKNFEKTKCQYSLLPHLLFTWKAKAPYF